MLHGVHAEEIPSHELVMRLVNYNCILMLFSLVATILFTEDIFATFAYVMLSSVSFQFSLVYRKVAAVWVASS